MNYRKFCNRLAWAAGNRYAAKLATDLLAEGRERASAGEPWEAI